MCGICGFVGVRQEGLLQAMADSLIHRGPDAHGYFEEEGVGLGHRRLSIIDVAGGRQPIENESGTLVLIANGEIYNYRELRDELRSKGHRFQTASDCEVLVHLYEEMGPRSVERLSGMYAYAIYDRQRRSLFMARDRLGIKPLYFANLPGGRLLFASEMKAILRYPGFEPTLDARSVHDYLALRYTPGPGGMFKEVEKLPAGHWATYAGGVLRKECYWRPSIYEGPFAKSEDEYLEGLETHFQTAIERRLMSDVPFGAYLSGGLDSSVIVAAMSRATSSPVRTFSVGFDYEHDELRAAADTARRLGCEHTEIACTAEDVALLPKLVWHLDEPVGDGIVVPMYQLAREAKKKVTVILAGEGADEILGGYLFHKALLFGHRLSRVVPGPVRRGVLRPMLGLTPSRVLNLAFSYPADLGDRGKLKVMDFLSYLDSDHLPEAYRHLISLFDDRDLNGLYTAGFRASMEPPRTWREWEEARRHGPPFLNRALHLQFAHWLSDDILTKQDKMSMASGIEARVPFLDHELVEYALRIPPHLKIRRLTSKYLLRRLGARLLPDEVVRRPKMPFYLPLERYADTGAFQELLADTLSERSVRHRGMFEPSAVRKLRDQIHSGDFLYLKQVFSLVVLELWLRMAVDARASRDVAAGVGG